MHALLVSKNRYVSIGYIVDHEYIILPSRSLYLKHLWHATKELAFNTLIGLKVFLDDVTNVSLNVLYSPIRAVELAIQPLTAKDPMPDNIGGPAPVKPQAA